MRRIETYQLHCGETTLKRSSSSSSWSHSPSTSHPVVSYSYFLHPRTASLSSAPHTPSPRPNRSAAWFRSGGQTVPGLIGQRTGVAQPEGQMHIENVA
eukprot:1023621-Pyramimonas_sp.AAC.1